MKRLLLAAACLMLVVPTAANAATKTKLVLDYTKDSWFVEVKSKKKACKKDRKVTVFHKTNPGKEKVGSAHTTPGIGDSWVATILDSDPAVGDHFAKAKATNRCKGAKSNIVTIAG
jgi:hypothetical protein